MNDHSNSDANNEELIVEDEVRIRGNLDPHICSINLRPRTNNPTEGYDLAISANFGSEFVQIPVGDENHPVQVRDFQSRGRLGCRRMPF